MVCHDSGVIHRDLKLENVLFTTTAHRKVKVVDFGIAGMCKGGQGEINDAMTLRYATPEMLKSSNSKANPSQDVWTIGIMLYAMLFNSMPFDGSTKDQIKDSIIKQSVKIPKYAPVTNEVAEFISMCLNKDANKRIMCKDMIVHPWMLMSDDDLEDQFEVLTKRIEELKIKESS
jgi:serine/threonine protein kinase